jgi:hypothetical protein
MRRELLEAGVFRKQGRNFVVTQDYRFDSPSTAAATMLGRVSNGRQEWRDEQGRTLKELQAAAIESEVNLG